MASVFKMQKMHYALEKFGDFISGSGSGAVSAYAAIHATAVIDSLCAFEEKLHAHGTRADDIEFYLGTALYAACQFQAYVAGEKGDIANPNAALVYRDFLEARIEKLHLLEQDMDSLDADNAIGGNLSGGFILKEPFRGVPPESQR
ncbi:MAG TPA: hypothetical protein VJN92_09875 [Candidatus Acidoferrum sp.]|nr:hypothetical protein [Candidatus Acidoferrum sp.]